MEDLRSVTADEITLTAFNTIDDPAVRSDALAFVSAFRTAVVNALSFVDRIKDDPEAAARLHAELGSLRS